MARLDIASPGDRETLKKEIKQEIKQDQLRMKLIGFGGCALIVAVLLAIPTYVVAATLARTGFFNIPVLSQRLYKPSAPVRRVLPLVGSNAKTALIVASTNAKFNPNTNLLTLRLTETDLTTMAQEGARMAKQEDLPFPVRDVQIAVDERSIELFAVSPQKGRDATVRARFLPLMNSGKVDFEVQEVMVGALKLPKWLAQFAFGAFSKSITQAVVDQTKEVGTLFSIEIDRGAIRFLILPAKKTP